MKFLQGLSSFSLVAVSIRINLTNTLSISSSSHYPPQPVKHNVVQDVTRVLCLSDLHVDKIDNLEWLKKKSASTLTESDLLIVAGDISHRYERLRDAFKIIQDTGCRVIFVPGNHEAWDDQCSYRKLKRVKELCRDTGVLVDPTVINSFDSPLWVLPLLSWYDGSLEIPGCEDLCTDFSGWPWTDFRACEWNDHPPMGGSNAKIPLNLANHFHDLNMNSIDFVKKHIDESAEEASVITVSHFLPNAKCLPDWKDITLQNFQRKEWLDHGAPGTSSKFAKVAGSTGLQRQIQEIRPVLHVFGHSHRPKDFVLEDGIRYVHNPLGTPRERLMYMVSPAVDFQVLWNEDGQVAGETVIRLWEEQGGGIIGLKDRVAKFGRKRFKKGRFII